MTTNWNNVAAKVYNALKKDGIALQIIIYEKASDYDIAEGKPKFFPIEYESYGIMKNIENLTVDPINPETLEISFHPGLSSDPNTTLPRLSDKDKIEIRMDGVIYQVGSFYAVRPAGVVLMYKAKVTASIEEFS